MMITAIDLDGTLLSDDTTVSKENLAAIKRLYDSGILTLPVTGRTFYEIPQELIEADYIRYCVFSNGAAVFSRGQGNIFYSPIKEDTAKKVFELLNSYETFIELYADGTPLVDSEKFSEEGFEYYRIDRGFLPEMRRSRRPVNAFSSSLENKAMKLEMFDVFFRNQFERAECTEMLERLFPELEVTTSMDNNLEIMNRGINKGTGLKKFCELTGSSIDDIIAVGDSKNDLTFFNAAKTRFAVSNACSELKSISSRIICSNEENVMCYMEKYYKENGYI